MKKVVIIVLSILAVVAILATTAFFFYQRNEELAAREQRIYEITQNANDIVEAINSQLQATAPLTWVYDRDENLILSIKVSKALQGVEYLPDDFIEAMGKKHGDLHEQAVRKFFSGQGCSEETFEGYLSRVRSEFDIASIARYLATDALYGGTYVGLLEASSSYFGILPSQLNASQFTFLSYTYENPTVDINQYCLQTGISAERLGLASNTGLSALRSLVIEELSALPGVSLAEKSYHVKLTISSSQQDILQSVVDTECRSFVSLAADGSYAVDCSALVVDRNSGNIRAMVAGRSSTQVRQDLFKMNCLAFSPNFEVLINMMKSNRLAFSLIERELSSGETELVSLKDRFYDMTLESNAGQSVMDVIDLIQSAFSQSTEYTGISLVYQVLQGQETVYRASGDSALVLPDVGLYDLFSTGTESQLDYKMCFELESGLVYLYGTDNYTLAILLGSGALGNALPSAQFPTLYRVIDEVSKVVSTFYPMPKQALWNADSISERRVNVYKTNQDYIVAMFTKRLDDLKAIEINSQEARKEFELTFEEISNFVSDYTDYIGVSCSDALTEQLSAVRIERAALLVQYSV